MANSQKMHELGLKFKQAMLKTDPDDHPNVRAGEAFQSVLEGMVVFTHDSEGHIVEWGWDK